MVTPEATIVQQTVGCVGYGQAPLFLQPPSGLGQNGPSVSNSWVTVPNFSSERPQFGNQVSGMTGFPQVPEPSYLFTAQENEEKMSNEESILNFDDLKLKFLID